MSTGVKDLTKGGIFRQLTDLALPIMATGFIQMAYSLTDMAWVGRIGSESAAAVGSVGILMWLTLSVSLLTKIGAEVTVAQSIGAGKMEEAGKYASHTTTLGLILSLVMCIILFSASETVISFFRLEPSISRVAGNYLKIVSTALPFTFLANTFAGIYNASGRSKIPFFLTGTGLVMNMVLDPLFIFGIGGVGGWGTNGAAMATWLSQAAVFSLFVWQMKRHNGILNRFPYLVKLRRNYTFRIVRIGAPVSLMSMLFASINMYLARTASTFGGHIGVTSQTTGGQIEGITWTTSQGFATALGAFVAQNYGAGKLDRARRAYFYTVSMMVSLGVIVSFFFIFFGEQIFGLFIPEQEAKAAGGQYLMIVGFSQVFMMLELTTQGMFNGYGRTVPPALVSIVFNILRIPLAIWLASRMGLNGVWWAIAISTILKGIVLPAWFYLVNRKMVKRSEKVAG